MMPSKKKKYNARFPAGRIKKIMQTDEEVGKVAQAVPVIISRTLELFVQSLLVQATRVTTQRNAKTLSPSHLKQCILHEARFDFLRDLVKNIPDVSAAEEKEMQENSPSSAGQSEPTPPSRPENSSVAPPSDLKRRNSDLTPPTPPYPSKMIRTETVTSTAIDLSKRSNLEHRRVPNFYKETLKDEDASLTPSVIRVNPSYAQPQPSTSQLTITPVPPPRTPDVVPKIDYPLRVDLTQALSITYTSRIPKAEPRTPATPITPIFNIDFTKNIAKPEFQILDSKGIAVQSFAAAPARIDSPLKNKIPHNYTVKALSRSASQEHRKVRDSKTPIAKPPLDIDRINSGTLEIDEDYDT